MTMINFPARVLFLIAVMTVVGGCMDAKSSKDRLIAQMIKGGLSVRNETLSSSNGLIADYKVYRDGDKDGVVFEIVYAADVEIDYSVMTAENTKKEMVNEFSNDPDVKRDLARGVYARLLYKTHDGQTVCDVTITSADLR